MASGSHSSSRNPHLLTLPYDLRHLIYQHLFPADKEIFLGISPPRPPRLDARPERPGPHAVIPPTNHGGPIPTAILSTCRVLHAEANEYLYNTYVFYLIGPPAHCLQRHANFVRTAAIFARAEIGTCVSAEAAYASTVWVAVHVGEAKRGVVERWAGDGMLRSLAELEGEVRMRALTVVPGGRSSSSAGFRVERCFSMFWVTALTGVGVAIVLAMVRLGTQLKAELSSQQDRP